MKLAQVLMDRKEVKRQLRQVYDTFLATGSHPEGLSRYQDLNEQLTALNQKIAMANAQVHVEALGVTLAAALEQKDGIKRELKLIERTLYPKKGSPLIASNEVETFKAREAELRKVLQEVTVAIQEVDWLSNVE